MMILFWEGKFHEGIKYFEGAKPRSISTFGRGVLNNIKQFILPLTSKFFERKYYIFNHLASSHKRCLETTINTQNFTPRHTCRPVCVANNLSDLNLLRSSPFDLSCNCVGRQWTWPFVLETQLRRWRWPESRRRRNPRWPKRPLARPTPPPPRSTSWPTTPSRRPPAGCATSQTVLQTWRPTERCRRIRSI